MKSYEIETQLRSLFNLVGVGYEENAEHTDIERTQTDQGRGGVVLDFADATVGQLWNAIKLYLEIPIDDKEDDEGVNFAFDAKGFWLLRWFFRNPTGEFGASWTEFIEFTCEIELPSVPDGTSHGNDDMRRERVAEYLEGWEHWPTFADARILSGNVYIGPR
ncbi:MAG: hypothetical protein K0U82_04675 [Planctomycetes bacterium]|nr:hypothetical protein [Planctomycetota bacterium]